MSLSSTLSQNYLLEIRFIFTVKHRFPLPPRTDSKRTLQISKNDWHNDEFFQDLAERISWVAIAGGNAASNSVFKQVS